MQAVNKLTMTNPTQTSNILFFIVACLPFEIRCDLPPRAHPESGKLVNSKGKANL
ncbi:hypothetical protein JCM30471_30190 [Desulfuromonas carbonis]